MTRRVDVSISEKTLTFNLIMVLKPQPKIVDSVAVDKFFNSNSQSLKMTLVAGKSGLKKLIRDKSINRPSIALTGYLKFLGYKRIQLFGAGEMGYLRELSEEKQYDVLVEMARRHIVCVVISRNMLPTNALVRVSEEYKVPLIRTQLNSRDFIAKCTVLLENVFAPQLTEHGTMMDIRGIGTLLRGDSGMGKSECALALIERGHSLVADDVVYVRLINERELMATSSVLNRGYMECRGLGIINIAELFGIRSVRLEKHIDLVVTFSEWSMGMEEDRTGLEENNYEILKINVPHIELPVRPGRDLARLVEVAAMTQALKLLGHYPAKDFNDRLIQYMADH